MVSIGVMNTLVLVVIVALGACANPEYAQEAKPLFSEPIAVGLVPRAKRVAQEAKPLFSEPIAVGLVPRARKTRLPSFFYNAPNSTSVPSLRGATVRKHVSDKGDTEVGRSYRPTTSNASTGQVEEGREGSLLEAKNKEDRNPPAATWPSSSQASTLLEAHTQTAPEARAAEGGAETTGGLDGPICSDQSTMDAARYRVINEFKLHLCVSQKVLASLKKVPRGAKGADKSKWLVGRDSPVEETKCPEKWREVACVRVTMNLLSGSCFQAFKNSFMSKRVEMEVWWEAVKYNKKSRGPDLTIMCTDLLTENPELPSDKFVTGVQWDPALSPKVEAEGGEGGKGEEGGGTSS